MSKYKQNMSKQTIKEAEKTAKATQRPGQTKEQTKLIAQGIQKGIEFYKKQNKVKSRELDKKLKSVKHTESNSSEDNESALNATVQSKSSFSVGLPWLLLILTWVGIITWSQM